MQVTKVLAHPDYQTLQRLRRRMSYWLTFINVLVYSLYVLALAYERDLMRTTVGDSVITVGLWFTIAVIIFSFAISGFYIWWTNTTYDPLHDRFLQQFHAQQNETAE